MNNSSATPASLNAEAPAQVPSNRVLVVGCGYLGTQLARSALRRGDRVWATTRRHSRAEQLASEGIQPLIADWTDRRTLRRLPRVDRILIAVSYDHRGGLSRYDAQVGGLRNLLEAIQVLETTRLPNANPNATPPDLCYISTTGVYHQTDGRWVDETSPTHPTRQGGKVHLQAEQLLRRLAPRAPWTILRLAGIYGPGRVPRASDVIQGRPIASPPSGYLNLIHVEDAARAVMACWDAACATTRLLSKYPEPDPTRRRLYLVADDRPVIRGEFYREIARQTRSPLPEFVSPRPGDSVSQRSESNKRIWNRRLKRDLLPRLSFPSYREGLATLDPRLPNSRQRT